MASNQLDTFPYDGLDDRLLQLGIPRPGEIQKTSDDFSTAQDLLLDDFQALESAIGQVRLPGQVLGKAKNDLQGIVEFMSDRGGQLADRDQPIGGDELLFQLVSDR